MSNLGWLRNEGQEQFNTLLDIGDNLSTFEQVLFLESADLDQDGLTDVIAIANARVVWFRNNGDKSFSKKRIIDIRNGEEHSSQIIAIDIDKDGDKDVVFNNIETEEIYWSENDGVGNFSPRNTIVENARSLTFTIVDIDEDGDDDLLVPNDDNSTVELYVNDGTEIFTIHDSPFISNANTIWAVDFMDLNNDSFKEIISVSFLEGLSISRNINDSISVSYTHLTLPTKA